MWGSWEIAYVPIKKWIIDPDVHGPLDGPDNDTVYVPTQYGEIVHTDLMTWGVTMVIEGEGALRCSLNLSPEVLATSPMYSSSQLAWACLNL